MSHAASLFSVNRFTAVLLAAGLVSGEVLAVPGNTYAYIPNSASKTLSVINTATGQLTATLTASTLNSGLTDALYTAALRPGSANEVWFGQLGSSGKMGVVDTSNNTFKSLVTGTGGSVSIVFSSDGAAAYVSDYSGQKLHAVNATTKAVTSSVGTSCSTIASVIKSDNSMVYFRCGSGGIVKSYTVANNTVATVATTGTTGGYGLAYDPTGSGKLYVNDAYGNQVKVIDLSNNAVSTITVSNASGGGRAVAVRKDGSKLYVAIGTTVHIIDTSNTSNQTALSMGASYGITGMAVSANDAALYVVLSNGTVKVVSTTTDTVTATVTAAVGASSGYVWGDFLGNVTAAAAPSAGPTVSSSTVTGSPAANAGSLNFDVVFSEAVTGVDAADFTLAATGSAAGTVGTPTTPDNITWTVPVTGVTGDGTLRLNVNTSGTGIAASAAGNAALSAGLTGTAFTVDHVAPVTSDFSTSITPVTTGLPFKATINEAGTGYWMIVPHGSTAPTAADIVAAADYGAVTMTAAGNSALTAGTAKRVTATATLTPGNAYDLYFVAKDSTGNQQADGAVQSVINITFPNLTYDTGRLAEAGSSNGTVSGSFTVTLAGDTFTGNASDDLIALSKATVTNVPAGLTAVLTLTNATTATLSFTGNASAKADVGNVTVTFADGAFTGGSASSVVGATTSTLQLDFNPALAYSGTTFAEAVANDGSVTDTATLTLSGDKFTGSNGDNLAQGNAPGVTVSNVPAGLTAVVTRNSDTTATLSFTGTATSHQAANNITNLTVTVNNAGLLGGNAANGTNMVKNDLTMSFTNNAGSLAYSGTSFAEASGNDGSITATATLTLTGETFTGSNGDELVGLSKAEVSHLPTGLTATITRTSATTATLAFTGNAASHAANDGITNLGVTFYNAAFTGNNASGISNGSVSNLEITFADPAEVPTPTPPTNIFNPGGNQTQGSLDTNAGVTPTAATNDLVTNLSNLDNRVGISDNGVVVVLDNGLKEPVKFKDNPPDNVLISMPSQKPLDVQLSGNTLNIKVDPETPKPAKQTILGTSTLTLPDGTQAKGLQLVQGEAAIGNTQPNGVIGGLELSKGSTLRSIVAQSGSSGGTAGFKKQSDGSGSVSAENGDVLVTVRLKSVAAGKVNALAAGDAVQMILKSGEVARFNAKGELVGVFAGSLSGTAGKTGDLVAVTAPTGLSAYPAKAVKLDGDSLGRLGSNLLPAFAATIDGTSNLAATGGSSLTQDVATGVVTARYQSLPDVTFQGLPIEGVPINVGTPDGIEWNARGSVTWTLKGVSVTFVPVSPAMSDLAASIVRQGGYGTQLLDYGVLRLSGSGSYLVGVPRFAAEKLGKASGFSWDESGKRAVFTDNQGYTQIIDPVPYDGSQLDATVAAMPGWKMSREYSLYGSLRLTGPGGEQFLLTPDYVVTLGKDSAPTGAPYVGTDGRLFYSFSTGFLPVAQGFEVK